MRRRSHTGMLWGILMTCSFGASTAQADDASKTRCTTSYVIAQSLRKAERFADAKAQMLICKETCPPAFSNECDKWLREIEALPPKVRFVIRDSAGKAVNDVRVSVDGRALVERVDGQPVAVPAGTHVFRFEANGYTAAETRTDVAGGVQEHVVEATLSTAPPETGGSDPPPVTVDEERSSRVPSYVLGGVGIAALLTGGGLALKGHIDRQDLYNCSPNCDSSRLDSIRTIWYVAGAVAAVGAISVGAAILLWPKSHKIAASLAISPRAATVSLDLP